MDLESGPFEVLSRDVRLTVVAYTGFWCESDRPLAKPPSPGHVNKMLSKLGDEA